MIDGHVHIERGAYTIEWLMQFVNTAINRGIKELYILEHSHRFIEFREIYHSVVSDKTHGNYQRDWINRKCRLSIKEFKGFRINYNHEELGVNKNLLNSFISNEVEIITASDAHRPEDVGLFVREAHEIIIKNKKST